MDDVDYDKQSNLKAQDNSENRQPDRRTVVAALGTLGFALAGCAPDQPGTTATSSPTTIAGTPTTTPSCILAPQLTEGPYYLDTDKIRRDITEGRPGVPLQLRVTVVDSTTCAVIEGAAVDIWHCDASGFYSGFTANDPDGGGGMGGQSDNLTFLRGVQVTDANGVAEFTSIYPGWYAGRAIHIHVKVFVGGSVVNNAYEGGHVSHTGQFFFDESITGQVAQTEPYADRDIARVMTEDDGIFPASNPSGTILNLTSIEDGNVMAGFLGEVTVGIDTGV